MALNFNFKLILVLLLLSLNLGIVTASDYYTSFDTCNLNHAPAGAMCTCTNSMLVCTKTASVTKLGSVDLFSIPIKSENYFNISYYMYSTENNPGGMVTGLFSKSMSQITAGEARFFGLVIYGQNNDSSTLSLGNNTASDTIKSWTISQDNWHSISFVHRPNNNSIEAYVDGTLQVLKHNLEQLTDLNWNGTVGLGMTFDSGALSSTQITKFDNLTIDFGYAPTFDKTGVTATTFTNFTYMLETVPSRYNLVVVYDNATISDINVTLVHSNDTLFNYGRTVTKTVNSLTQFNFSTEVKLGLIDLNTTISKYYWVLTEQYRNGSVKVDTTVLGTHPSYFGYYDDPLSTTPTNILTTQYFNIISLSSNAGLANSTNRYFTFNDNTYTTYTNIFAPISNLTDTSYTVNSYYNITYDRNLLRVSTISLNVSYFNITDCRTASRSTTETLNLTIYNESNGAKLTGNMYLDFTVWAKGSQDVFKKYISFTNTSLQSLKLCIYPEWASLDVDSYFINTVPNGFTQRYYLVNATITNTRSYISLYNYDGTDDSSILRLIVQDSSYKPMEDVIVKMLRYRASTHSWETVQVDNSIDPDGLTVFSIEEGSVDYKFIFEKDNVILRTTSDMKFLCSAGICDVTFVMPNTVVDPVSTLDGFLWNYSYNNVTGIVYLDWDDTTGLTHNVRFNVSKETMQGSTSICAFSSSTSAGSTTCNISAYSGTIIVTAYKTASPERNFIWQEIQKAVNPIYTYIGKEDSLVYGFLIFIAIICMSIWSATALVISTIFALILIFFTGLVSWINLTFVISALCVGIVIIFVLRSD